MHKQNYSVNQLELYVVHLLNAIFFYLFIDYKHKHTATGRDHTLLTHSLCVKFFFIFLIK